MPRGLRLYATALALFALTVAWSAAMLDPEVAYGQTLFCCALGPGAPTPTPTPTPTPSPSPSPGALIVSPTPLPPFNGDFGQTVTVNVSQSNYGGSITWSGCATPVPLATLVPGGGGSGTATSFNISSVANGTCTITVIGGGGQTAPLLVVISSPTPSPTPVPTPTPTPTPGLLLTSPTPFPTMSGAFGQTIPVRVSQTNYLGTFTWDGCQTPSPIVTMIPGSGSGPSTTMNVTSVGNGTCTITVHGFATSVPILVTVPLPTPTPTPVPPAPFIQAYAYNCPTASCVVTGGDPGSSAAPTLWGVQSQSGDTANNAANLTRATYAFAYNEDAFLTCSSAKQGPAEQAYNNYLAATAGYPGGMHTTSATPGPAPALLFNASGQGSCAGTGPLNTGGTEQFFAMNPNDATGTQCIYQSMATNTPCANFAATGFVSPWADLNNGVGLTFDNQCFMFPSCATSSGDYGISFNYLPPTASNFAITNAWMVDRAAQYDTFCQATCVPIIGKFDGGTFAHCCDTNTGAAGVGILQPTAANVHFAQGAYNGMVHMDVMCKALKQGNLKGWALEDPVSRGNANLPDLFVWLNTFYYLRTNDSGDPCGVSTARFPIEETDSTYFSLQLAITEMVQSQAGLAGDVLIPWRTIHGAADSTQVGWFVDYTMHLANPVQVGAPFTYGGITTGGNQLTYCPAGTGNGGGVKNLVVACPVTGEPVLREEFLDNYTPAGDMGTTCVVANTSSVAYTLTGSECTHASYNSTITFAQDASGGALEGAWIPTVNTLTAPQLAALQAWNTKCTNTTHCIGRGSNPTAANAVSFNGAIPASIPAHSAIWEVVGAAPPSNAYTFVGCPVPVQMYGTGGVADPIAQLDISSSPVDANSATIIAHLSSLGFTFSSGGTTLERAGCVTNATPTYVVQTNGGHNPPISTGPYGGGAGAAIPFCPAVGVGCPAITPIEGGTSNLCPSNDGHFEFLNTDNGMTYEGGNGCWTGTQFKAFNGGFHLMTSTFSANWGCPSPCDGHSYGDNWSVGGVPSFNFTLHGDDMLDALARNATVINHPLEIILQTKMLLAGTNGFNISPGVGNGNGSCVGSTQCPGLGELFRLKPGATCPSPTDPQVIIFLNTLKHYGAYVDDTGGSNLIRTGLTVSGSNPFDAAFNTCMASLSITNFDIIQRGLTRP